MTDNTNILTDYNELEQNNIQEPTSYIPTNFDNIETTEEDTEVESKDSAKTHKTNYKICDFCNQYRKIGSYQTSKLTISGISLAMYTMCDNCKRLLKKELTLDRGQNGYFFKTFRVTFGKILKDNIPFQGKSTKKQQELQQKQKELIKKRFLQYNLQFNPQARHLFNLKRTNNRISVKELKTYIAMTTAIQIVDLIQQNNVCTDENLFRIKMLIAENFDLDLVSNKDKYTVRQFYANDITSATDTEVQQADNFETDLFQDQPFDTLTAFDILQQEGAFEQVPSSVDTVSADTDIPIHYIIKDKTF